MTQYEECLEDRLQVAKAWGLEEYLVHNDKYTGKFLWISPGWQCSLHYHDIKQETFIALDGLTRAEYYTNGGRDRHDTILVGWRRDVLTIPPGTPHRFWSITPEGSLLLEISTPHSDEDVTRLIPSRQIPDAS